MQVGKKGEKDPFKTNSYRGSSGADPGFAKGGIKGSYTKFSVHAHFH